MAGSGICISRCYFSIESNWWFFIFSKISLSDPSVTKLADRLRRGESPVEGPIAVEPTRVFTLMRICDRRPTRDRRPFWDDVFIERHVGEALVGRLGFTPASRSLAKIRCRESGTPCR